MTILLGSPKSLGLAWNQLHLTKPSMLRGVTKSYALTFVGILQGRGES